MIVEAIKRIQKLNEERYSKTFNILTEESFIAEELSEILRHHRDIEKIIDGFADAAVFSVGSIYKCALKLNPDKADCVQIIGRILNLINDNQLQNFIKNGELKDKIFCKCNPIPEDTIEKNLKTMIEGITKSTASVLSQLDNASVETIVAAQVNDLLIKLYRLNELAMIISTSDEAEKYEYELLVVFTSVLIGTLVNTEILGYDADKVLDEVLKHIESRTGKIDPETGKWIKDKFQKNIYTPDFSKCKKVSE